MGSLALQLHILCVTAVAHKTGPGGSSKNLSVAENMLGGSSKGFLMWFLIEKTISKGSLSRQRSKASCLVCQAELFLDLNLEPLATDQKSYP